MALYTSVDKVLLTTPAVNSITNITSGGIAHYIDRAETLINARLAGQFTVPLSSNIPILEMIATDLAIYEIISKRASTMTKDTENDWPSRFKKAETILSDILSGDIVLYDNTGALVSRKTNASPWSNTMDYAPTFREDDFEESHVDFDKLEDIINDRS